MYISVIIPTLNAGANIEQLLSMIREQDVGPSEVIIIDSSSEDKTVDIVVSGSSTIFDIQLKYA